MSRSHVAEVVGLLQQARVRCWVDGGWGVDALLGEQTRPHQDLDLVVVLDELELATAVLRRRGWSTHLDELPTRLELRTADDRRVDMHPVVLDEAGDGHQRLPDGTSALHDAAGLRGTGRIGGLEVATLTPQLQLRFHQGYPPRDTDRHDVALLVARFGLPVPPGYERAGGSSAAGALRAGASPRARRRGPRARR